MEGHEHDDTDLCACGADLLEAITNGYAHYAYTEGTFTIECYECGLEIEVEAEAHVTFKVTVPKESAT